MLPSTHSTNLYDKMLTNCNIITASNDPVTSCDNIQINHSVPMSFSSYQAKFSTRKLNEYYPHQSVHSKNSADLRLQVDASADCTSCRRSLQYTLVCPVPTLPSMSLNRWLLVSKYRTISWYHYMERDDISIRRYRDIIAESATLGLSRCPEIRQYRAPTHVSSVHCSTAHTTFTRR